MRIAVHHAREYKAGIEGGAAVVGLAHCNIERAWIDSPVDRTARAQRVACIAQRDATAVGFAVGGGRRGGAQRIAPGHRAAWVGIFFGRAAAAGVIQRIGQGWRIAVGAAADDQPQVKWRATGCEAVG